MERRTGATRNGTTALLRVGAASTAFLLPIILAAAYLNMGQTCCGSSCPPPDLRISKTAGGLAADDASIDGFISGDGTNVAFSSLATNLDPGASALPGPQVYVHNIAAGTMTWVSLGALGQPNAKGAGAPVLSKNGQYIAFTQELGAPTAYTVIFRDLTAVPPTFETLISASSPVSDPTMSADGRYVAFATEAQLLPQDTDAVSDIYRRDRQTGALTFLSTQATGGAAALRPRLSGDGQVITFEVEGGSGSPGTIVTDVAGVAFSVFLGGDRPTISDDGSVVAFRDWWPGTDRIFVYQLLAGLPEEVSVDGSGNPTTSDCDYPVLSGNGRYVAFRCTAPMTDHGIANQVYVRDLVAESTKLASLSVNGAPANSTDSKPVSMTTNGAVVIIESGANNLGNVPGGFPQQFRVPIAYWSEGGTTCSSSDASCDGVDDDCDGQMDEDYVSQTTSCGGGACASTGSTSCVNGIVQDSCVPLSGTPEGAACNGIDDDCDGLIDEDYIDLPSTCGFGPCESTGLLLCQAGIAVDTCTPGVPGATEDTTCDGVDNDCDGMVDEDCVICIPATCRDYNINCGAVDDGCDVTIDCGVCAGEETCGGGGTANVCGIPLPPDPGTVAPPGPTGAGSFFDSFAFLTEGPTPVQTGVQPGAVEPHRAAIVRGRVASHSGAPLSGVTVSVPGDSSLGQTLTRADGRYDLLVNGGGKVILQFDALAHLPVQRSVDIPWADAVELPEVVMSVQSDIATPIAFGPSAPAQLVVGRTYQDEDGVREVAGFVPAGTQALVEIDGQSVPLENNIGTLRITEYTVGPNGPKAMPAKLPENVLYTFAVDLSLDEVPQRATVRFNQSTYFYVDNFLDLPVGAWVPSGSYDFKKAAWIAEEDGLVMKVVGLTADGLAEIDTTYDDPDDDLPEDAATLALLGMTDEERREIGQRYTVGTTFWRVPIAHLSPWDWNHAGFRREPPPPEPVAPDDAVEPRCSGTAQGSIIHCQSRSLAEEVPIAGTPFRLRYDSDRAHANVAADRTVVIDLPEPEHQPGNTEAMILRASVLGREIVNVELPLDTDTYTVSWDGLDALGRPWLGPVDLRYTIEYRYTPSYRVALAGVITGDEARRSFGSAICVRNSDPCCTTGAGVAVLPTRTATPSSFSVFRSVPLGSAGGDQFGFGGWSLSPYHLYDRQSSYDRYSRVLLRGDGRVATSGAQGDVPTVVAGRASDGNGRNDVDSDNAEFSDITNPTHLAVGPDGTVYFRGMGWVGESSRGIWERTLQGGLKLIYQDGDQGVRCGSVYDLAVDRDGQVYVACGPEGVVRLTKESGGHWRAETFFGAGGPYGSSWDGLGQATLRDGNVDAVSLAFREDGTLLFTAAQTRYNWGYRRYGVSTRAYELIEYLPDGRGRIVEPVETNAAGDIVVVGVGWRIAPSSDNTLVTYSGGRVFQIFPNSTIATLMKASGTAVGFDWESTETHQTGQSPNFFGDIAASSTGDVYLSFTTNNCSASLLYQISRGGQIRRVSLAGLPQDYRFSFNNCIQTAIDKSGGALLNNLAVGPAGRLYATSGILHRIYSFGAPGAVGTDQGVFEVASDDGSEIYHFSSAGLHQSTVDAQTGAELFRFGHDADGRLESITDRDGRMTRIERPDASTIQVIAPAGPNGTQADEATTTLTLNGDGFLEEVTDPRGATWSFEYLPPEPAQHRYGGGLLSKMWDPRANEEGLRSGAPYDFQYEPFNTDQNTRWLLKRDTDPVNGQQTLSQEQSYETNGQPGVRSVPILGKWCDGSTYTRGFSIGKTTSKVTRTTGLGRATTFETSLESGSPRSARFTQSRQSPVTTTRTEPSGWSVSRQDPDSRNQGSMSWPGGSLSYVLTAHERLGAGVTVPKSSVLTYDAVSGHGALQQETAQDLDADFTPQIGYSTPNVETVTTTVTPQTGTPRISTTHYDGATRTMTVTSPATRTSAYVLDDRSRIVRLEVPGQVPTVYSYDVDGFLRTVIRTKGASTRTTTFNYDPRGYVSSVQNKVSDTVTDQVTMVNDAVGFATQTSVPGLLTVGSTPDLAGALSTLTPDGKPTHQLSYTPLGQLAEYASPAGTLSTDGTCPAGTQCWGYSLDRELEDITLPDGTIVDYVYDPDKATLTSIDVPGHGMTTFGYDSVGRRVSATTPTGGTMTFAWQSTLPIRTTWFGAHTVPGVPGTVGLNGTVERFYNDFLEVSELHVTGGKSVKLLRDNDGLVTDIVDLDTVSPFPTLTLTRSPIDGHIQGTTLDTVTTSHVLDVNETTPGFGDLLSVTATAGPTDIYDAEYTYDDRGRIETWTESLQGGASVTRKFGYDAAGRLLTVHDISGGLPGTPLEEYLYDGNGNRNKAVSTYPGATPLNAELGVNLGCPDASGTAANDQDQLCQYGEYDYVYNARGQLQSRSTGGTTTQYTYDGLGRLQRVTEPGMDIHYVLDALGRRIGKIRDGNLEKGWLYADALNPIAQLDSSGNVQATFLYGTRAHVPDAMAMADGTTYRFVTDHLGSVRLVVDVADGTVVQRLDYDSFGRVLTDTNPGFQPFGFAGGLYDDDTGLVRFGARDYDAYAGRWTAKDPLIFEGLQSNLYQYVASDPVNLIDPSGEIVWFLFGAGAAIGAAAQFLANYGAFNCGQISTQDFAISLVAGALTGALASLPSGLLAATLAGAGGAGINELVNGSIGAKEASVSEFAQSAGLGALGSAFAAGTAKLGSNVLRPDRVVGQNLPLPARQTYGVPAGVVGTAFGTVAASKLDN